MKTLITNKLIKSLNPCESRFNNYLKFYKNKELTKSQFLGRKHITHEDKLWVVFRLMTEDQRRLIAADIAEIVLPIFEKVYPKDKRPRLAIEAARSGVGMRNAADAAANAASHAANAASYAGNAASCAASYAAYASYAAARADAAYAAANAANASCAANRQKQEKLIRKIILKYWKNKK